MLGLVYLCFPCCCQGNHTPLREDFVYLNPDVMTASGIIINQHVSVCLVTEEGSVYSSVEHGDLSDSPGRVKLILRAWPAQKLPFESAFLFLCMFGNTHKCLFILCMCLPSVYSHAHTVWTGTF